MVQKLKRTLVLLVSLVVCLSSIPLGAFAEEQEAPADESQPTLQVLYRLHALGIESWEEDEAWQSFFDKTDEQNAEEVAEEASGEAAQEAAEHTVADTEPEPLGTVEVKLSDETEGLTYTIRNASGAWSEEWAADGAPLTSADGVTGVQVKLSEVLGEQYDVWYRATYQANEADGAVVSKQSDWVKNGEELVSPNNELFYGLEVALTQKGAEAPSRDDATTDEGSEKQTAEEQAPAKPEEQVVAQEQSDVAALEEESAIVSTESEGIEAEAAPQVTYRAHVQTYGWNKGWVSDGALAGTTGEAKRMEALNIKLNNASGGITYQTHVQTYGWQDWVSDGAQAGTTGEAKRVEAIRIKLTGSIANQYDVWYRVHGQTYGWQSWKSNGEMAGTTGMSKRLEAIEIILVKKGSTIPTSSLAGVRYSDQSATSKLGVHYQAHVQTHGWMAEVADGSTAGTTGQSKRVEALRIQASGIDGGIRYQVYGQTYGWQDWVSNGEVAGTTGQAKRLEAIRIELTGNATKKYNVWYRAHCQSYGWMSWVSNGEVAGVVDKSKRMEAIEILLLEKGANPPSETLNGVDISGWNAGIDINNLEGDFVIIKSTEGVTGNLTNPAYYNPSYKTWANQAIANGKLIGFYHYANGGDPIKEADWFYYSIKDYKGRAIAVLDWEGQGNPTFDTGKDVAWCKKFLDRLQSLFGGTPFLYTSKNYTNVYDWSSVAAKYPLWGAEYPNYDPIYGYQTNPWQSSRKWGAWGSKPTIFQYTSTGVLPRSGGMKQLDLNLFYGNRGDFKSYMQ